MSLTKRIGLTTGTRGITNVQYDGKTWSFDSDWGYKTAKFALSKVDDNTFEGVVEGNQRNRWTKVTPDNNTRPVGQLPLQPGPRRGSGPGIGPPPVETEIPIVPPVDPLITFVRGANFLKGCPPILETIPAKMQNLTLGEAFDSVPAFSQQHWVKDGNAVTLTFVVTQVGTQTNMRISFVPNMAPGAKSQISEATFFADGNRYDDASIRQFLYRMYYDLKELKE